MTSSRPCLWSAPPSGRSHMGWGYWECSESIWLCWGSVTEDSGSQTQTGGHQMFTWSCGDALTCWMMSWAVLYRGALMTVWGCSGETSWTWTKNVLSSVPLTSSTPSNSMFFSFMFWKNHQGEPRFKNVNAEERRTCVKSDKLYLLSGLQVYSAHISVVRLPAVHNSHDHLIGGQGALLSCFLLSGQRCSLLHQKVFRWSARKQLREKERVYERWSEHYTHSILIKVIYESLWCCVLILQTPGVVWLWCIHPHTWHWRVQDPELHTPSPCAAGMLVSPLCWTADRKKQTENFNHRKS